MGAWWLIALSVFAGVLGQILIKLGVGDNGLVSDSGAGILSIFTVILTTPLVMGGLVLYGVGAISWILVLSRMNLSYAYPFLALNFVLIAVLSRVLLQEPIPMIRWVGMGIICVGIVLVSQGGTGR